MIPDSTPIVGRAVLVHESGIHVAGMLQNTSAFEPFPVRGEEACREADATPHGAPRAARGLAYASGLAPGIHSDTFRIGDPLPALVEHWDLAAKALARVARRRSGARR